MITSRATLRSHCGRQNNKVLDRWWVGRMVDYSIKPLADIGGGDD